MFDIIVILLQYIMISKMQGRESVPLTIRIPSALRISPLSFFLSSAFWSTVFRALPSLYISLFIFLTIFRCVLASL